MYRNGMLFLVMERGKAEKAMEILRNNGSQGGTVINARGTAGKEAEKLFNISIQPEKELVIILVEHSIRDKVLHALYKGIGLGTAAQGIAFALPVDAVAKETLN